MSKDFAELENDEELLITLGNRQYIVKVANEKDLENHNQTTMYADTSNFFKNLQNGNLKL
jgi:hypothetical protein